MKTMVCVLRRSPEYGPEYVDRLRLGAPKDWRFVALSDCDVSCERIPLIHDWPGWWSKIELFRPGLFDGPVLYLDLDTIITGSLEPLLEPQHKFTMLSDFFSPRYAASGVMAWEGDFSYLYGVFAAAPDQHMASCGTRHCWGDGGFIASNVWDHERWDIVCPGKIVSRKVPQMRNDSELLVCYHGKPRPADTGWAI